MKRLLGFLIIFFVLIVACGQSKNNPYSSGDWKKSDECRLLSKSQVEELWGYTVNSDMFSEKHDDLLEEAELNRIHDQLLRAKMLQDSANCLSWLYDIK